MFPCPFILPAAFLLDILAGEPPNRFHPVCLIGRCARHMETLARQRWGGTFHAGMAAALATCIAAWFGCAALFLPFSLLPYPWAPWIPSVLVIYICMAPRSLAEHARKVENALRSGNAGEARHSVSMIVGRDTERMDGHGIARAAIESVAENLTDGVFSTLFWASAGCLAGGSFGAASAALAHRVFNILDAMWGKKNDRYRHFGTFAARTDERAQLHPRTPYFTMYFLFRPDGERNLRPEGAHHGMGLPECPRQPQFRMERSGLRWSAGPPSGGSGLLQGNSCKLSLDRNRANQSLRQRPGPGHSAHVDDCRHGYAGVHSPSSLHPPPLTIMNKLHIPPLDEQAAKAALEHQKILAKPPLALGKLEPVAIRIAAMTGNPAPRLKDKAIVLFAADHHIADHGLSLTSTDVTYIQTRNFLQGGGTINAFTRNAGARLSVVDVGVNYDFGDLPGLVKRKVMHGANDFSKGPAMTREQALECLQVGIDMAREEKNKGLDIVAAGEMGIGNTTPSSAIVAVLTGTPVETVTGRGSGVRGEVIRKKIKLIEQGITLNKPDPSDAIDVLAKVGGPEIGAMAGLMLGAASLRVPIVIDGFIAGAAAAIAQGIRPEAAQYFIGSHNSAEPGHKLIMDHISVTMYMDLGLCLGEGTGAALFFPLLDAAMRVLSEMKTLPELDITVPC